PWPTTPRVLEMSSSHEEGGERTFLASTVQILGTDHVEGLRVAETEYLPDGRRVPKAGTEKEIPADLVLVAMGFAGPDAAAVSDQLGVSIAPSGPIARGEDYATTVPGVFVAGDAGRGQSLIVWAIAEGRAVAAEVDKYLTGATELPVPVRPQDRGFQI
ncbi:MAG TPA: glutamate synthase, partial [Micrococcales bacterium]|uniref:FAD-dependent oxidoreductase n=1 Tax=Miniimonas arenae TaxID=676201 RepID=UPI000EE0785E